MLSQQIFGIKESALHSIYALICRQSGVVTTLDAIGGDGLYKAYCPLLTYRVSGSKCATITANAILSSERSSRCASQKKPLWDSSKTYSPKGFTFRDVQLMLRYHDKITERGRIHSHPMDDIVQYA